MLEQTRRKIKKYFGLRHSNMHQEEGVITLADGNYFEGLIILYNSIQFNYPVPVICYDIGLLPEQKKWLNKNLTLLTIKPIPDLEIIRKIKSYQEQNNLAKKHKRQWALWICPFLIQDSPFIKTFWLDCDLIVLRNLDILYQKLDDGPIFTPENLAPHLTANKPELYKHLPPAQNNYDENKTLINAGVSGWNLNRDREVLNDYANIVKLAFDNESIKSSISWHDQGALIWAILNNGLENRVEKTWKWNRCVKHTKARGFQFTWEDRETLEILRTKVPEANILHWNGQPVPWNIS